jgi:hypothetical protein
MHNTIPIENERECSEEELKQVAAGFNYPPPDAWRPAQERPTGAALEVLFLEHRLGHRFW